MKRTYLLLAPPLVFALAAVLAFLNGAPADPARAAGNQVRLSPRQREAVAMPADGVAASLLQLEHQILRNPPAPPSESHDAEGMEKALADDDLSAGSTSGGMAAIVYAWNWPEEAPEAMLAWLIHQGGSSKQQRMAPASILFRTWAATDMPAALAAVARIPNSELRAQALASAVEILCKTDPGRARELMQKNLGLFASSKVTSVFRSYETGETTCDLLLSLPPSAERTNLLAGLLNGMAGHRMADEDSKALAVWKSAPDTLRRELVAAGFEVDREPSESFEGLEDLLREQAETSGNPEVAESFMRSHGPAWAKRDLAGALAWAQARLKGKNRVERSASLFKAAASQDFDTAVRVWQTLPAGSLKTRAAEAIATGAPPDRKPEAAALQKPPPERDR